MSSEARRKREQAELRTAILDAAESIIVEQGFAALTMRKLGETIEYSPALLYRYFENRDAIAIALVERGFEQLAAALGTAMRLEDPIARLRRLGIEYVRFGTAHSQTYRLIFMENPLFTSAAFTHEEPDLQTLGHGTYAMLLSTVQALLTGAGSIQDPREMTDALWSNMHGIVALKLGCPAFPLTDVTRLIEIAVAGFLSLTVCGESGCRVPL